MITPTVALCFVSETAGVLSTLTNLTAAAGGMFVGGILGVNEGSGALLTQGEASQTLTVEKLSKKVLQHLKHK